MPSKPIRLLILLALATLAYPLHASDTYLAPDSFVSESFDGKPPKPRALWLSKSLQPDIKKILGHDYPAARVRYWRLGNRSTWILEEIGKTKPITTGIAIEDGKITRLRVLIYRESRGWEVKYPFFTDQFKATQLDDKKRLSKKIDGISGATLSVNALEKLSRLALYFHQATTQKETDK